MGRAKCKLTVSPVATHALLITACPPPTHPYPSSRTAAPIAHNITFLDRKKLSGSEDILATQEPSNPLYKGKSKHAGTKVDMIIKFYMPYIYQASQMGVTHSCTPHTNADFLHMTPHEK
jgi:hypothetical protein